MVQLNPNNRLSCEDYLQLWRGKAFPSTFYTFLHPFLLNLQDVASIAAPAPRPTPTPGVGTPNGMRTPVGPGGAANVPALAVENAQPLKSNADDIVEKLWHDFEYASGYFSTNNDENDATTKSSSVRCSST